MGCPAGATDVAGAADAACATDAAAARECRICLSTDDQADMVQPCQCTGSVQSAHLACLKAWCMENLSLKCEICGSVYEQEVVNALMDTLLEAQSRNIAMQGFAQLQLQAGVSAEDEEAERIEARARGEPQVNAAAGGAGRSRHVDDLQAFLDELVQVHVRTPPLSSSDRCGPVTVGAIHCHACSEHSPPFIAANVLRVPDAFDGCCRHSSST